MTITFLGTGTSQGVPVIACECDVCRSMDYRDIRSRTSIHIQDDETSLVVDTGPDFRSQILRERITSLDAVLFTHQHRDHTAGLDEVRSFNFSQKKDMPIYGTQAVLNQLQEDFGYIFSGAPYPGLPRVVCHTISNEPFDVNNTTIRPVEVMHYKLPVLGFRIKNFTYITDANFISDEEKEKIKGSDVLVLNALQVKTHISHYNLEQALEVIEELQPKQAFLTHISHNMGLHKHASSLLPKHVQIAVDGLKISL